MLGSGFHKIVAKAQPADMNLVALGLNPTGGYVQNLDESGRAVFSRVAFLQQTSKKSEWSWH